MNGIFDNRLRYPVEFVAAAVLGGLGALLLAAPHTVFPLMPGLDSKEAIEGRMVSCVKGIQMLAEASR